MKIIGAGMAGLIAANYFRKEHPEVWELQSELPHNHAALLRFRTDAISKAVGIPFKKVKVHKAVVHGSNFVDQPNPYVCNQYSLKTNGKILDRSIWDVDDDYRYIAPHNFIELLSMGLDIKYGQKFKAGDRDGSPIISTIPMPIMMKEVGWSPIPEFEKREIWALNANLLGADVDVYQTIYFSDLEVPYYRASIVGNRLIAEFVVSPDLWGDETEEEMIDQILDFFGMPTGVCQYSDITMKQQEYGKIIPIADDDERKEFMYSITHDYNIYSLGRFATWRQILLDDLVNDLHVIEKLMSAEGRRRKYVQRLNSAQ